VKDGSASIEQGVGVRALAGEKTGFAYSDEIVLPALEEASRAARAIAAQGGDGRIQAWQPRTGHSLYLPADALASLNDDMMILVVDDHPINRRLLADQLGSLGYQCKTANDGVDALNVLSKNHIDIVLSDVNMPNMDGYRLTQRIRQLGLTLPVVGVTANALAEEKQRCLESGMDSCLSKPVTLDVLKQTISVYAERVRKARV